MPSATENHPQPIPDSQIPTKPPDLSDKLPKLVPRRSKKPGPRQSSPPPATPPLSEPPALQDLAFAHPTRRILSPSDHERFLSSKTHELVVSFAFSLAESVRKTPISAIASKPQHPTITSLLHILDATIDVHKQSPPDYTNGSRFGNPAFRTFLDTLTTRIDSLHRTLFSITDPAALDELSTYYLNSFGSAARIDYGSGHELNFLIYALCLNRLSLLPPSTFPQFALLVLPRYLHLMRALQESYYLEPAGSHGVWGLDDYHFLPFLLGAAQLADHPFIRPLAIHNDATLDAYADDFLYLDMVRHVNATKTVQGLRWHSPMLDDISGVKAGWSKIEAGMRRMFLREVLGKLVVMQHFLFGGLVPAAEGMGGGDDGDDEIAVGEDGHVHLHGAAQGPGDCCAIKVPSAVGAVQEDRKKGERLRRLPFD